MALQSSRIFFPDRVYRYGINPRWAKYDPKFVLFPAAGDHNLINGEFPNDSSGTITFPTAGTSFGGRTWQNDGTASVGFAYDKETGNVGSEHSVFFVGETVTSPSGNILSNGTTAGGNKPFNYRLLFDPGVARGMRYTHDTGPNAEPSRDFNIAMKDAEPSTVSFSVHGTDFQHQTDGQTGTYTLSYAPVDTGEGSLRVFSAQGASAAASLKFHLIVVFDKFIPNEVMYHLHANPRDFFGYPRFKSVKVPTAGPAVDTSRNLLLLGVG
jgi:hypothetical protein